MSSKRYVCLGDSITWGYPYGPEYSWVHMLEEQVQARFINEGINGDTTGGMLRRFDKSVVKHRPSHVIIMGGINDVMLRESFARTTANFQQLLQKAEENRIQVILGLPTVVDYPEFERMLVRIRDWLREVAEQKGIPVIDFSRAFYNEDGSIRTELLLPDGGHPTEEGYREIFKVIDLSLFAD